MEVQEQKNIIQYTQFMQKAVYKECLRSNEKDFAYLPFKYFQGRYIMFEKDFIRFSGIDIAKHKDFYCKDYFIAGKDWNAWNWENDIKNISVYLYPCGVRKAINILIRDKLLNPLSNMNLLINRSINY